MLTFINVVTVHIFDIILDMFNVHGISATENCKEKTPWL
jgi:hypothetical protein